MPNAEQETERLAQYLMKNFPEAIRFGLTAVDIAILLLNDLKQNTDDGSL
ncbi:2-oxoglutarate dehydrogenase complex dehydrogenase (E1) component-like enzyme [Cryobacterium psychrotolerans]|nr:2-oxoglutarate dehydrogenase complex dehydrogenase (E1) component-like enzyme [Cryobacterium psychrotolerans]